MRVTPGFASLLFGMALCLGTPQVLGAASDSTAQNARGTAAQLPPVIVRPEPGGFWDESDRHLRSLKRGLPAGESAAQQDYGVWIWQALGFGGRTIQDIHPADQQRAADFMQRLGQIRAH